MDNGGWWWFMAVSKRPWDPLPDYFGGLLARAQHCGTWWSTLPICLAMTYPGRWHNRWSMVNVEIWSWKKPRGAWNFLWELRLPIWKLFAENHVTGNSYMIIHKHDLAYLVHQSELAALVTFNHDYQWVNHNFVLTINPQSTITNQLTPLHLLRC